MFFGHAMFGAAVFMLLDAPSVRTMGAVKSTIAIVVFYVVLCTVFVAGASMWPQFDPEDEKGKIAKILAPKRAATEQGKAEELIARTKALDEQVKALEVRLKGIGRRSASGERDAGRRRSSGCGQGANWRLYEDR